MSAIVFCGVMAHFSQTGLHDSNRIRLWGHSSAGLTFVTSVMAFHEDGCQGRKTKLGRYNGETLNAHLEEIAIANVSKNVLRIFY